MIGENVPRGPRYTLTLSKVTVGGEDIADAVPDDGDGGSCCAFKCIHGKKRNGRQEEDCKELIPQHGGEDEIENVEAPHPKDNSVDSIIVDDDNLGYCLYHNTSFLNFFLEEILNEIHNYLHDQTDQVQS